MAKAVFKWGLRTGSNPCEARVKAHACNIDQNFAEFHERLSFSLRQDFNFNMVLVKNQPTSDRKKTRFRGTTSVASFIS